MQDLRKTLEFYQDLGINEILNEKPINRLNNNSKILDITQVKQEKIATTSQVNNVITNNFSNMTQSQAISRLAQKQANNNSPKEIKSIADIVKKVEDIVEKIDNLEELEKSVRDFDGCNLKRMATNTVFSDGNPKSEILIIGEAPGNEEDLQGIPFCGDSGKLLNQMFLAIGKKREDLYITNTLFWRPPGNRKPTGDELAMCKPFVEKHIELIAPKLIILMGATAMTGMLKIQDPISQVRGKFLDYQNKFLKEPIKIITLFHPSYLMRQPNKKRVAWQDLIAINNFFKESK